MANSFDLESLELRARAIFATDERGMHGQGHKRPLIRALNGKSPLGSGCSAWLLPIRLFQNCSLLFRVLPRLPLRISL